MAATSTLAEVAGLLALLSLLPSTEKWPLVAVACLLLAIAVYLHP